jgi:hypothetical protein
MQEHARHITLSGRSPSGYWENVAFSVPTILSVPLHQPDRAKARSIGQVQKTLILNVFFCVGGVDERDLLLGFK